MNEELKNKIIRMGWEDRTTFDEIEKKTGFKEADVIKLMRKNLKASSFRRWRKRVSGRMMKHEGKFQENRQELKKVTTRKLLEQDEWKWERGSEVSLSHEFVQNNTGFLDC